MRLLDRFATLFFLALFAVGLAFEKPEGTAPTYDQQQHQRADNDQQLLALGGLLGGIGRCVGGHVVVPSFRYRHLRRVGATSMPQAWPIIGHMPMHDSQNKTAKPRHSGALRVPAPPPVRPEAQTKRSTARSVSTRTPTRAVVPASPARAAVPEGWPACPDDRSC